MRLPDPLATLIDYGIIQEVVRPLMSGKEAQVYLVVSEGQERVAKVYKEAQARTFKHRSEYTEGRKTRNSRDQRAIAKRTKHGRAQDEAAWRSTEVDMIHRLNDAGVRVPTPYQFIDGVLVMELIKDADGRPAPRLGDLALGPEEAQAVYDTLIAQVVKMLCAGVVHGDLSDFNVLMAADGPALIDFPQSIDPAGNPNAQRLLLRDVDNLHRFLARHAPLAPRPPYAQEMWALYTANKLHPTTRLTGGYRAPTRTTDTRDVLDLIRDARDEAQARRERREGRDEDDDAELDAPPPPPRPLRKVVDLKGEAPRRRAIAKPQPQPRGRIANPAPRPGGAAQADDRGASTAKPGRRRRRPRKPEAPGRANAGGDARGAPSTTRDAKAGRPTSAAKAPDSAKKRSRRRRRRAASRAPGRTEG